MFGSYTLENTVMRGKRCAVFFGQDELRDVHHAICLGPFIAAKVTQRNDFGGIVVKNDCVASRWVFGIGHVVVSDM